VPETIIRSYQLFILMIKQKTAYGCLFIDSIFSKPIMLDIRLTHLVDEVN
jgi:hypothetical protein